MDLTFEPESSSSEDSNECVRYNCPLLWELRWKHIEEDKERAEADIAQATKDLETADFKEQKKQARTKLREAQCALREAEEAAIKMMLENNKANYEQTIYYELHPTRHQRRKMKARKTFEEQAIAKRTAIIIQRMKEWELERKKAAKPTAESAPKSATANK